MQKILASNFALGWEDTRDDAAAGSSFAHSPKDPFAKFGRMLDGKSHAYVAAHPLQPAGEFDPVAIVGNGQSFFGSSKGGPPKERLGTPPVMPEGFGEASGK